MGLLGPSAPSAQRSDQVTPAQGKAINETFRLDPRNKYAANARDYDRMAPIKDTFTTLTSVNPTRYPEVYKMLAAYPKGFPMVVPYYHRQDPSIHQRTFAVSLSMDEDTIHEDLTKINHLEMKLESSIEYTVQEEDKSTQLTGSAIMYPGLEPYEGDFFFLEVDNGQSVIFIINKVDPTTYRQERYYKVSFYSFTQLTEELLRRIEAAVTDEAYFEKRKYLGESELAFLSADSWKMLKELESLRRKIAQDTVNFFFDRDGESFFRPDGLYDPYVVEFLRSKLTIQYDKVHPLQLLVPLENYDRTIWYKFILAENCEDFSDIWRYCIVKEKPVSPFRSDYNYLTGKNYIYPMENGGAMYPAMDAGVAGSGMDTFDCGCYPKDPRYPHLIHDRCAAHGHHPDYRIGYEYHYPECPVCSSYGNGPNNDGSGEYGLLFTDRFYDGYDDSGVDDLERFISKWLKYREVDIPKILGMVRKYRKLGTGVNAFYKWALYLELVDACITTIR